MNTFKKIALAAAAGLITAEQSFAAINAGSAGDTLIGNTSTDLVGLIRTFVLWVVGLLALAAVIMGIYAGYLIVTAGGDEEKVKKGKNILIQVAIGIVVIFLANTIVQFVMGLAIDGKGA